MPRIRSVKPEFFRDPKMGRMSVEARLLYIGLWTEADDNGNGRGEVAYLKGALFAYDSTDVSEALKELQDAGRVVPYFADGELYYHLPNFCKHQPKSTGKRTRVFPAPEDTLDNSRAPLELLTLQHDSMIACLNTPPKPPKGGKRLAPPSGWGPFVDGIIHHVRDVTGRQYYTGENRDKKVERKLKAEATRLYKITSQGDAEDPWKKVYFSLCIIADEKWLQSEDRSQYGRPRFDKQYVRPSTLFCNGHVDDYLAEAKERATANGGVKWVNGEPEDWRR